MDIELNLIPIVLSWVMIFSISYLVSFWMLKMLLKRLKLKVRIMYSIAIGMMAVVLSFYFI